MTGSSRRSLPPETDLEKGVLALPGWLIALLLLVKGGTRRVRREGGGAEGPATISAVVRTRRCAKRKIGFWTPGKSLRWLARVGQNPDFPCGSGSRSSARFQGP